MDVKPMSFVVSSRRRRGRRVMQRAQVEVVGVEDDDIGQLER